MDHFDTLENVLNSARRSAKGSWFVYNQLRNRIVSIGLSCDEYEDAINKLTDILDILNATRFNLYRF